MRRTVVIALAVIALVVGVGGLWLFAGEDPGPGGSACPAVDPVKLWPRVIAEVPHDPGAFTQGLVMRGAQLWESTGLTGESSLRRLDPRTGEVQDETPLDPDLFGEGLAVGRASELVQLTWKAGRALRWDPERMKQRGEFSYDGEGWGLSTVDGGDFVMSDGSDTLTLRSPVDFSVDSVLQVERSDGSADRLNELEWDGRRLWANRWQTDEILRIDLDCAVVDGVVDASALNRRADELSVADHGTHLEVGRDVLNGIAQVGGDGGAAQRFYVTGKNWPVMFEVRFLPG